ncbi:MAG: Fic family protein, partial [Alphaproteobacteria bacterium]|nr:Fic family protein [Alphaproteobacteria bacterium]
VFLSSQFTRVHRDRLIKHGFLSEVMKGWLIITDPSSIKGDSTTWYASFWTFVKAYLNKRFGDDYCLSPEASILMHIGATAIPKQVTIITKKVTGQLVALPHSTTLLLYNDIKNFPEHRVQKDGIWIMEMEEALCRMPQSYFEQNPIDAEIALRSLKNTSKLLEYLLSGKHSTIAGRLVGAYSFLGEKQTAELIKVTMTAADYSPKIINPFSSEKPTLVQGFRFTSPYSARIESLWSQMREEILAHFPSGQGLPKNTKEYLQKVEEGYVNDAYNSLSIEGYRVTPELIVQIQSGNWNPDLNITDIQQKDALAAKGYQMAFRAVKKSISRILEGENSGDIVSSDHPLWYIDLFSPMVQAGILKLHNLSGYRNHPVFIKQSMHVPPPHSAIPDCMETYCKLLREEESASVRAILGHFVFVYIHPYSDGNGRIGRFIMNCMLASGGFDWCVVPVNQKERYMIALEAASYNNDIKKFTTFIRDISGISANS